MTARLLDRGLDALIVVLVSVFVAVFSGSQRWTGFNSPDSEFYASLALFGDEVTTRSDPAYTWTRLGYIAPVRLLVTRLDPWLGFALWRFVLLLIIIGSVYAMVRMVSTWPTAALLALFAGLNTVVLSFAGNSYLTGTVMAGLLALIALGAWPLVGRPSRWWPSVVASGAVAAWLVMTNPYGMLLGLSVWLGLRTYALVTDADGRWRRLLRDGVTAAAGFGIVFGLFLLGGAVIFPGRNWFQTYLIWNDRLDYASFVGDATTWQRDTALLVPVGAILIAVIAYLMTNRPRAAVAAVIIASANVAFTIAYVLLIPGPWFEAPTYVAKLWPAALAAVALSFGALAGRRGVGWPGLVLGVLAAPLLIWAGHWSDDITAVTALVITAATLVFVWIGAIVQRGPQPLAGLLLVAALAGVALGSQVLQNGRGSLGVYGQFPFRAAYQDFQIEDLMRSKVAAEEFVLAQTKRGDRVMLWTDPDRLTAGIAGMQLWGWYNNLPEGPTLSPSAQRIVEQQRPDVVAMYAPTREQIDAFHSSLPRWSLPSVPVCTSVPFLGIGSADAHICVSRLRWAT